jgi:hypothetical protein
LPLLPQAAAPCCSDHCGSDYQFYYCSEASFGCCRIGGGLLRLELFVALSSVMDAT